MDNSVTNSDSDLSDDWSIVNTKEAPPVVSESESIEVIEDDDNDDEGVSEESDKETEDSYEIHNKDDVLFQETTSIASESEFPVSRIEELEVVPENSSNRYCVFPEEFHNVFVNSENSITTSELLCSISLVILCTVASSFMVISADNLRPSFIDVLVWQSLPDYEKDVTSLGSFNQQLKERNEFLENKLSHLSLAVKAFEENMISDTALAEFIVDLERSVEASIDLNSDKAFPVSETVLKNKLSENIDSETSDSNINRSSETNSATNESEHRNTENLTEGEANVIPNVPSDNVDKIPVNERSVKMLNSLLPLFNTTSETGSLLNRVSLMLLNNKEKLLVFKKSVHSSVHLRKGTLKFNKLNQRLNNIEANINHEINKFFDNFSKKIYSNMENYDKNVNEFICKYYAMYDTSMIPDKLKLLCHEQHEHNTRKRSEMKDEFNKKTDQLHEKEKQVWKRNVENSKFENKNMRKHAYKPEGGTERKRDNLKFNRYSAENVRFDDHENENVPAKEKINEFNEANDRFTYGQTRRSLKRSKTNDYKRETERNIRKETARDYNLNYGERDSKEEPVEIKLADGNFHNEKYSNVEVLSDDAVVNGRKYGKDKDKYKEYKKNSFNSEQSSLNDNVNEASKNTKVLDETIVVENQDQNPFSRNSKRPSDFEKYDKITFKKLRKESNDGMKDGNLYKPKKNKEFVHSKTLKNSIEEALSKDSSRTTNDKKRKGDFLDERNKNSHKKKDNSKYKSKIVFSDIKQMKEDILNSIHKYIDELLINYSSDYNHNNNSSPFYSKFLPGDWFLTLGKKRSELRDKERRSDWLFNRAEGRNNIRDLNAQLPFDSSIYEKTYWYFRRAWERNRIRF